jgi:hypothetical protein
MFNAIKTGKIDPAALTVVLAASCLVLEGEKHEKTAQQLTEIMNNYVALHSSATTDSPTGAKGIYIISYFAGSGGTGGVGLDYKDTFYDVATKKILGEIHGTN